MKGTRKPVGLEESVELASQKRCFLLQWEIWSYISSRKGNY